MCSLNIVFFFFFYNRQRRDIVPLLYLTEKLDADLVLFLVAMLPRDIS